MKIKIHFFTSLEKKFLLSHENHRLTTKTSKKRSYVLPLVFVRYENARTRSIIDMDNLIKNSIIR